MRLRLIFISLLIVALAFSFNPAEYKYSNETTNITYSKFTLNGDNYSIVLFNDNPTFLLKNGEVVLNKSEIETVLNNYYKSLYAPSEEEVNEVLTLLNAFNASRNDGDNKFHQEEYQCRVNLGINFPQPKESDLEKLYHGNIYYYYALLIASNYMGQTDIAGQLEGPIEEFFVNSFALDDDVETIALSMEKVKTSSNLTEIYDAINESLNTIPDIVERVETIRNNKMMFNPECSDCWGMCAMLSINETALEELNQTLLSLEEKSRPLASIVSDAETIYEETQNRIFFKETEAQKRKLMRELKPIEAEWNSTKSNITWILSQINDLKLSKVRKETSELLSSIYDDFDSRKLNTTEDKIKNLSSLVNQSKEEYKRVLSIFLNLTAAEGDSSALIEILEIKGIPNSKIESFKEKKANIDAKFIAGISTDDALALASQYSQLNDELRTSLREKSLTSTLAEIPSKIAGGIVNAVYSLIKDQPYSVRMEVYEKLPIAATVLFALGVFGLILLSGFTYYSFHPMHGNYRFIFFSFVFVIGLFLSLLSALVYFPLKAGTEGIPNIDHMIHLLSSGNNTISILIYTDDPFASTCAHTIGDELIHRGANIHYFYINNETCTSDGEEMSLSECLNSLNPPYIMLKPADSYKMYGSLYGETHVIIEGTPIDFSKCKFAHYISVLG